MYILFFTVNVAEWPPFGKELLTRLTVYSLCIISICSFSYFPIWFEGRLWVVIALVPDHCLRFTRKCPRKIKKISPDFRRFFKRSLNYLFFKRKMTIEIRQKHELK